MAAACIAICQHAHGQTPEFETTFTPRNPIIPDANMTGWVSGGRVFGIEGTIDTVEVLLDFEDGWNGDLYGYLWHQGHMIVLLNRPGSSEQEPWGSMAQGFDVTLSDSARVNIDDAVVRGRDPTIGLFKPDGRNSDPLDLAALCDVPRATFTDTFGGLDPNGDWFVFFADLSGGAQTRVDSWGLRIYTCPPTPIAPEPSTAALSILALGCISYIRRRTRRP